MKVKLREDYQVPAVDQARQALTVARLRELLHYDPESGSLTWLVTRGKCKAGDVVSCREPRGYIVAGIEGRRYYAHRVAWALAHGEWAPEVVDHINGDRGDNRLSNLRAVAIKVNAQNRHVPAARSKTQVLGVRIYKGRFRAQISINGASVFLGDFADVGSAQAAYLAAKRKHHEGCTL